MDKKVVAILDKLQELKEENASQKEVFYYAKALYQTLLTDKIDGDQQLSSQKVTVILPGFLEGKTSLKTLPPTTISEAEKESEKTEVQKEPVAEKSVSKELKEEQKERESQVTEEAEIQEEESEWETDAAPKTESEEKEEGETVNEKAVKKEIPVEEEIPVGAVAQSVRPPKQNSQTSLWGDDFEESEIQEQHQEKSPEKEEHPPQEVNEKIGNHSTLSWNDRLKLEQEELGSRLRNEPIKKLSHAIGINEKFIFIHELFREDQTLYNRSLQTIDKCKDFEEAMYWINRELKIKLGWQDENKTVQEFYQLVKKRFTENR